ncbi:MAG TPA: ATP-binding protein, partial [Acetobacteraceae bacterium]|nr:ATP-binding protein [Acetobacteraceae bacterium]
VWVSRLVAEMAELLHRAAGETVKVEMRAALDLWPCQLDPAQFESAVLNLAINARDAMPEGGTLTVAAGNATLPAAEAARLDVRAGDFVRVDVTDTGTGIAPEHLAHLFEPFFTTKEVGKGTGLGLAMVHGFARQSGGAATVASAPGRGTTFSLFLPRAEAEARAAPDVPSPASSRPVVPASAEAVSAPARGLGILVVEDDPEVREAVEFALGDAGHRVVTAADAAGALAVLAKDVPLDLLLCDVALPGGVSGLEVADAARRLRPAMRILLASGYGDSLAEAIGYEMLAKPFSQADLLRRVADRQAQAAAG